MFLVWVRAKDDHLSFLQNISIYRYIYTHSLSFKVYHIVGICGQKRKISNIFEMFSNKFERISMGP
jgi:hypothetical protein